ncbi:MAG: protein kinase domain-containing protein [Myxococcales bacterium]
METKDYGRYRLLKKLATGGMAEVFLAQQKGLEGFEKLLVIKRILPHLADDEEFVTMFLNEARIAARFNHPNIVQIYDLGKEEDTYFIAMEFIHGEDLGRIMRKAWQARAWIPVPIALRIIASVCEGLYYAHSKTDEHGNPLKVVHRDISPQNIIVSFDGNVKVVDFGIARAADQVSTTRSGAIKGKYAYMSPEQASGKVVDHRSDIFAVGLVLFELLTGMRPLKRENDIMTLKAAVECRFPRCSEVANVPPQIDPLVERALAKVADDRYQDARAFQMALENCMVEHRLNASTIHISEMMRELFGDRLAEEARIGEPVVLRSETGGAPVPPSYTGSSNKVLLPRLPTKPGLVAVEASPNKPPPLPRIASAEWESLASAGGPEEVSAADIIETPGDAGDVQESWEAPPGPMLQPRRKSTASLRAVGATGQRAPQRRAPVGQELVPAMEAAEAFPPVRRRSSEMAIPRADGERRASSAGHRRASGETRRRSGSAVRASGSETRGGRRKVEKEQRAEEAEVEEKPAPRRAKAKRGQSSRRRGSLLPLVALLAVGAGAAVAFVPELRERALAKVDELLAASKLAPPTGPADAAATALLNLESNVSVDVYLGEVKLGTTPLHKVAIPAGRQTLRLYNPNLGIERTVQVKGDPGDVIERSEQLELGRVRFKAEKECEVFINGRSVARVPGPPLDFFEGTYEAECRNEPLKLIGRQKVRIPKGSNRVVEVSFKLQRQQ